MKEPGLDGIAINTAKLSLNTAIRASIHCGRSVTFTGSGILRVPTGSTPASIQSKSRTGSGTSRGGLPRFIWTPKCTTLRNRRSSTALGSSEVLSHLCFPTAEAIQTLCPMERCDDGKGGTEQTKVLFHTNGRPVFRANGASLALVQLPDVP